MEQARLRNISRVIGNHAHSVRQELWGVLAFVAVVWAVFLVGRLVDLSSLALIPRYLVRLHGIATMTFLHGDWRHLVGNTFPLMILLALLAGSRARSPMIVMAIILTSGGLLWLFGRNGTPAEPRAHLGASVLVFGLVTFLVLSGILERRLGPLLISIVVGFLYGGMVLWEVLMLRPLFSPDKNISWEGHLAGAVGGILVAYLWNASALKSAKLLDRA
jgi:membrane associated rhomboid family serine protease